MTSLPVRTLAWVVLAGVLGLLACSDGSDPPAPLPPTPPVAPFEGNAAWLEIGRLALNLGK